MCMKYGTFPEIWKSAEIILVRKPGKDDNCDIKTYRPVSLLPVLGKAFETVINTRLKIETIEKMSSRQYGFVARKSTVMAIEQLLKWHTDQRQKHTMSIFLDITGAFDNLKWSVLHEDLERLGCSESTRGMIKSYLSNRTATLNLGGWKESITLTRGCPQGSILGPILWNSSMEELLVVSLPNNVHLQAYADDIVVSVAANNR